MFDIKTVVSLVIHTLGMFVCVARGVKNSIKQRSGTTNFIMICKIRVPYFQCNTNILMTLLYVILTIIKCTEDRGISLIGSQGGGGK